MNTPKKVAGLWIDHREALIVFLSATAEPVVEHIPSGVESQLRRYGVSPLDKPYEAQMVPDDDVREREFKGDLAKYYAAVAKALQPVSEILIIGPGEAKHELHKYLEKKHLGERVVGEEPADKMTRKQILERVHAHFAQA